MMQQFGSNASNWPKTCSPCRSVGVPRLSEKMYNLSKVDVEWPNQVSTSTVMPQVAYVRFIGMITFLFVAMQILHLIEP